MKASCLMNKKFQSCKPTATVEEVSKIMEEHAIDCLPVLESNESGRLLGIITNRDIVYRVIAKGRVPWTTLVRDFMSGGPITVAEDATGVECRKTMEQYKVRCLPVVNREDVCVGLITGRELVGRGGDLMSDLSAKVPRVVQVDNVKN